MLDDQTLFWRSDGIEAAWSLVTPVLREWEENPKKYPPAFYKADSWGPRESDRLLENDGRRWRNQDILEKGIPFLPPYPTGATHP